MIIWNYLKSLSQLNAHINSWLHLIYIVLLFWFEQKKTIHADLDSKYFDQVPNSYLLYKCLKFSCVHYDGHAIFTKIQGMLALIRVHDFMNAYY